MDYLSYLPIELWRRILCKISPGCSFGYEGSCDPIIFLSEPRHVDDEKIIEMQRERLQLLLVCQSLKPIAEELLFSEVHLRPLSIPRFLKCVAPKTPGVLQHLLRHPAPIAGQASPGRLVRRISIESHVVFSRIAHSLQETIKACPNINSLSIFCPKTQRGSGKSEISLLDFSRLQSLTSLYICSVFYLEPQLRSSTPICFPNLKLLKILAHLSAMDQLTCPTLAWLSIQDKSLELPEVIQFLNRHEHTIKGLEVIPSSKKAVLPLLQPVLPGLKRLETLVIGDGALQPSAEDHKRELIILNHSVKKLYLVLPTYRGRYLENVHPPLFPRLKSIVFLWVEAELWKGDYFISSGISFDDVSHRFNHYGITVDQQTHLYADPNVVYNKPFDGCITN